MRTISLIAAAATVFMLADAANALSKKTAYTEKPVYDATKIIPEGATLEYRINGLVAQTLTIPPGFYKISIKQIVR